MNFVSQTNGVVEFLPSVLGGQIIEAAVSAVVAGAVCVIVWTVWRYFVLFVCASWIRWKNRGAYNDSARLLGGKDGDRS